MILSSLIFSVFNDPVTLGLAMISFTLIYYFYRYDRSYPDGPFQYPLIGNIPQIAAAGSMMSFLRKNRQTYGDVYTIRVGGVNRVVINGYDNIHELLIKKADHTSNRSIASFPKAIQEQTHHAPGLVWAQYPDWKTMRSFSLNQLREEGMGKSWMEIKIMEEANKFVEHFLEPSCGSPIVMDVMMTFLTSNIISQMVLGKRNEYTDPELTRQNKLIGESFRLNFQTSTLSNMWFLRYLPGDLTSFKKFDKIINDLAVVRQGWIKETRTNSDTGCYVAQALKYAEQQRNAGQSEEVFNEKSVSIAVFQLYIAGTDTTSTALKWALLFMILNPDMQEKVRAEIKEQIGEREPSIKDKSLMPYTDAVLHETLRIGSIVTTALPHTLDKEVELSGKIIPANSELMINLTSVLHDGELFPEPDRFNPERFMGDRGRALKSKVIAFGIGRRACLGESLARMEFFLFFTTFLQKFRVTYPTNERPTTASNFSMLNTPQTYKIVFQKA